MGTFSHRSNRTTLDPPRRIPGDAEMTGYRAKVQRFLTSDPVTKTKEFSLLVRELSKHLFEVVTK